MKKIIFAACAVLMFINIAQAQVQVNSTWIRGNLIYYNTLNFKSWIDAIGPEVIKFGDDFNQLQWGSTADTVVVGTTANTWGTSDSTVYLRGWDTRYVSGGSGKSVPKKADSTGGVLFLKADSADNDGLQIQLLQESVGCDSVGGGYTYFGCRISIKDTLKQSDFAAGLIAADTDIFTSTTVGVYFLKADGEDSLRCVVSRSASLGDTTTARMALSANTWYNLEIYVYNGTATFMVNNVVKATKTRYVPRQNVGEFMKPSFFYFTGTAIDNCKDVGMLIDNYRVIQIDPSR